MAAAPRCYRFGPFVLDVLDERLWKETTPIPLGGKAFAVLERLLAHPNQLVTKDELLASVWPDTAVTEAVLTTAVRQIRSAIAADARKHKFVETVYGRGYRFVGMVAADDRWAAPDPRAADTPLVGRDAEWVRLQELLGHVRHRRERRIVLVAGEAGIGKTALAEAFAASAGAEGVWVAQGQCVDQYGSGEAYMPLLDALARLEVKAGPALTTLLREHAPHWTSHLSPGAAEPSLPVAAVRPERMLREVAQAIEAFSFAQPLLLVLEDLQWSDRATLEWLAYMVRRRDPARLLVLGTYRPPGALLHRAPLRDMLPELRHQVQCVEIVLDYLTREAVRLYAQRRWGDDPDLDALGEVLHRRTGGHPLFLASLADDLLRREKKAGATRDRLATAIPIPLNVRKFIEDRVQQVSEHDRTVLEAATVAGEQFAVTDVAAATGVSEADVEATCASLARYERILVADGMTAGPDGTLSARYRFRHALFHETIYSHISPAVRARLHLSIGNRLEAANGSPSTAPAAELAVHFEAGRDYLKAITYRSRAARSAIQRSAYHDAQAHLSRAQALIQLLPEGRDRLRQEAASALLQAQVLEAREGWGVDVVRRQYGQAQRLCVSLGEEQWLLRATWGMTASTLVRAEYAAARASAFDLLRLSKRGREPLFRMAAHAELGGIALLLGRAQSSRRHFDLVEALCGHAEGRSTVEHFGMDFAVFARMWGTHTRWYIGCPDEALRNATEVLSGIEAVEHPFTFTIAFVYAAMLAQFLGDRREVQRLADIAVASAGEYDFPYYRACAEVLRTWAIESDEGLLDALHDMRNAIGLLESSAGIRVPYYYCLLAEACANAGRAQEGLAAVGTGLQQVERTGERWWEPDLHRVRGALLERSKRDSPGAEACYRQAMSLARRQSARLLELRAAVALVSHLRGRPGEPRAREALREMYDGFTRGCTAADLQHARAVLTA